MSLNWTALYVKGRAKDIGIPWSEEELVALEDLGVHTGLDRAVLAQYVRKGILTVEAYEEAKAEPAPISRAALETQAKELGIDFAPETPDAVLEKAIAKAEKDAKKAATVPKSGGAKTNTK